MSIFPQKRINTESILLCLDQSDMINPNFKSKCADAIVNRGNIMYIASNHISKVICNMHGMLKDNGSLFLFLKSMHDSRYKFCKKIPGSPNRRKQINGKQKGLEMEFHNKKLLYKLFNKFRIKKLTHLICEDIITETKFADWTVILEKK